MTDAEGFAGSEIKRRRVKMPFWMCSICGHCLNDLRPPGQCPNCRQTCSFRDVTCYRPECGGEHNVDPLLTSACYTEVVTRNRLQVGFKDKRPMEIG